VFFVAAILAPPDVLSQVLLAVPMYILFELGILGARWMVKSKNAAEQAAQSSSISG
jgi:sec-independent protein translocase protein TatC